MAGAVAGAGAGGGAAGGAVAAEQRLFSPLEDLCMETVRGLKTLKADQHVQASHMIFQGSSGEGKTKQALFVLSEMAVAKGHVAGWVGLVCPRATWDNNPTHQDVLVEEQVRARALPCAMPCATLTLPLPCAACARCRALPACAACARCRCDVCARHRCAASVRCLCAPHNVTCCFRVVFFFGGLS